MKFKARQINIRAFEAARDYVDVCDWWADHGWTPVPLDHLSNLGYVAEMDGVKLSAVWLYLTGSAFAMFEFLVSNPNAPLKARVKSIDTLCDTVLPIASRCGAKSLFTSIQNDGLEKLFTKHGFKVTDRNMVNLLARVA